MLVDRDGGVLQGIELGGDTGGCSEGPAAKETGFQRSLGARLGGRGLHQQQQPGLASFFMASLGQELNAVLCLLNVWNYGPSASHLLTAFHFLGMRHGHSDQQMAKTRRG